MKHRRLWAPVFGAFIVLAATLMLYRVASAQEAAGQAPMRFYCAARVASLSRVGAPGTVPSIWRYELSGDFPTSISLQLTMRTTKGWYRVDAPSVTLLQDNGLYLSDEARFMRSQVHSPAQFFELPAAAGKPRYIWLSKFGNVGASPQSRCPAMWFHVRKRLAANKTSIHVSGWFRAHHVRRLNASVYNARALPPAGTLPTARSVAEPARATTCRHPFREARVDKVMPPSYPRFYRNAGYWMSGEVAVEVQVAPDGRVAGRVIASPSGRKFFDENALYAASRTTYFPKIGLCRPVPGYYIYDAEYGPV